MVKKTTSTVAVDQVDGMIRVIPRCSCHAGSRSRENLRRFDQSIQPGCKTQSSAFSRGFYVSAHANGGESTSGFKVTNCDLKSKRRTPLPAIRLHRIRCIDGCQHLEQPTRSSHEYDVRGRRWMDCIVRLGNGRAIGRARVNIAIMRTFVQLRRLMDTNRDLARKIEALEKKYDEKFAVVFEAIKQLITPPEPEPPRRRIGFHQS